MRQMLLIAALIYAMGQGTNFLFQLHLLHLLDAKGYGDAGLAHLLLITLIFLADLGYASVFLREAPGHSRWLHDWRCALAQRLVATLLLLAICSVAVCVLAPGSEAIDYWLGAAPAALLALINVSSPMIARGQRLRALLVGQVAWPVALLLSLVLPTRLPYSAAASAGIAVSLGFATQALVHLLLSRNARMWLPKMGKGQLSAALHLSLLGICGTLHDRLTPFLLAPLAPGFLPWYLLLSHALNGLSGAQAQISRLLLPGAATYGRDNVLRASAWVLQGTAAVLVLTLLLQGLSLAPEQLRWLALSATLLLAWGASASGGFLTLALIDGKRERPLVHLLLIGIAISCPAQLLATWANSPELLLWSRALCMLGVMLGVIRLQHLHLTNWGLGTTCLALLATLAGFTAAAPWFGLLLALPLLIGLAGQRPSYQATALQTP